MTNRCFSFRVQVGHAVVEVLAGDHKQALALGRKRLCEELPRLWDVLSQLPDQRFEITRLNEETADEPDVAGTVSEDPAPGEGRNVA